MTRTQKLPNVLRRKLVIVGDEGSGKTSLFWAYSHRKAPPYSEDSLIIRPPLSTASVFEARVEDFTFGDIQVELAFWDTDASEEYGRLRPLSYPETSVILITFAINSPQSLLNASSKWYEEVRTYCEPDVPILLVGCKSDFRSQASDSVTSCLVSRESAEVVAKMIGARGYYECSAHRVEGLSRVIEDAAKASMYERPGSCCVLC